MKTIDEIYRELPDGQEPPRCSGEGPGRPCRRGCPAARVFGVLLLALLPVIGFGVVVTSGVRAYAHERQRAAARELGAIVRALESFRSDSGVLPSGDGSGSQNVANLLGGRLDLPTVNDSGNFVSLLGGTFHYRCPGRHNPDSYDLWTRDRKGRPEGLRNWR